MREWWGEADDPVRLRAGFRSDVGRAWAIELGGELIGWLGLDEELDPDYRHAGLDIFLAPEHHGQRHGRVALGLAVDWLVSQRGHHRLTIDPAAHNARAIRVYQALGFRPVGIMRRYERAPDGTWHDGLLMDLLADERRAGA